MSLWSGRARDDGVRGFLVERGTPGYTTRDIHGKLSMRASVTSSLHFHDCRLPEDCLLARRERLASAPELSVAGALRHRLGRAGSRDGLLRNRAQLFAFAETVRRSAHRLAPTGAGEAGLDDHRNQQGATAGATMSAS